MLTALEEVGRPMQVLINKAIIKTVQPATTYRLFPKANKLFLFAKYAHIFQIVVQSHNTLLDTKGDLEEVFIGYYSYYRDYFNKSQ